MKENPKIAVVVPTIRPECCEEWVKAWTPLLEKHDANLIVVRDGETPIAEQMHPRDSVVTMPGSLFDNADLICNFSPACRMLGMYKAAKDGSDIIITVDDDCLPEKHPAHGLDPIEAHVKALSARVPTSWFSPSYPYMRGFPYGVRGESEVYLSHGVWSNVPDLDAPNQLVLGERPQVMHYTGTLPKGVYSNLSGMNVAFRVEALPYIYWAPVGQLKGCERFDDIWGFLYTQEDFWNRGWAIYTGYSIVKHTRASNVFKNLQHEARGIEINEWLWTDTDGQDCPDEEFADFLDDFLGKRFRWWELITDILRERE